VNRGTSDRGEEHLKSCPTEKRDRDLSRADRVKVKTVIEM
jgi:hypothetical protein